jgi:hypothetical protein
MLTEGKMGLTTTRGVLLLACAASFLGSWFLPVMQDVPGWMAFRYAFSTLWPYGPSGSTETEDAIPQVASALTNVAFVIMFVLVLRGKVRRPSLLFRVSILCFVMNLYWFVELLRDGSLKDLLIGYYLWMVAFALLVFIAWRLNRAGSAPL